MLDASDLKKFCFVLLTLGPALTGRLWADSAAYQRGILLEKAKDYQAALLEFQAVTEDDLEYVKARKEIGTCYYYLGQRDQALEAYEQYLAVNPADSSMQAFVQGLRSKVPAPVATPVAAKRFERRYGFRGMLGYGLALSDGGFGYGRYNDYLGLPCTDCYQPHPGVGEDVQNDRPYRGSPGAGLALGGEVLVAFRPGLELGLGMFPVGLDGKGSSTNLSAGNSFQSDNSSTHFQALPIMAMLYGKLPLGPPALSLVLGFGLGYTPAGNLTAHSDYVYDSGSGPPVSTSKDLTKSLGGAIAYRSVLGVEYALDHHFSVTLGLAWLGVNFSAAQDVVVESYTDSGTRYKRTTTTQYVDAPPKAGPVTDTGLYGTPTGWARTWDDGRSRKTEASVYDWSSGTWTNETQITTKAQKGLSNNDLAIQQLAPFLSVTWYY